MENGEWRTEKGGVPKGRDVHNPMRAEGAAWGGRDVRGERKTDNSTWILDNRRKQYDYELRKNYE